MQDTCHRTGNCGSAGVAVARASDSFIWLTLITTLFVSFMASPARADTFSLLLNGKAIHLEHPPGIDFNEENWGAGVQYDFTDPESHWRPFLTASGFKDSNGNRSFYAGGGTMRRFAYSTEKDSLHLDAGIVVFLMTRKYYLHEQPFLGALPVLSLGTDRVALNVTYIPKVDPKLVPIVFFQLKVGLF